MLFATKYRNLCFMYLRFVAICKSQSHVSTLSSMFNIATLTVVVCFYSVLYLPIGYLSYNISVSYGFLKLDQFISYCFVMV